MMTKDQEREALKRIENILADAGEDSYIGMAFAGCVEDAESNIENDWALSMAGRWQNAEQKLEEANSRAAALQISVEMKVQEIERLRAEIERLNEKCAELTKAADSLNKWRSDEHTAADNATRRAEVAEAEIIRLKAKLYDYMTAER